MSPDNTFILEFRRALLGWYREHARALPWRRTSDPYRIWISEIMLQQTRVAAVLEHYARFTTRFPTVQDLAAASEADVLALWSGLGYYRRARMMHRAAQVVVSEHGGIFPRTAEALLALPGIGAYTAAAVASIAFGEPVAVVDGNVERVLARVYALDGAAGAKSRVSTIRRLADELIDPEHPSHFNQAMMEMGATVCLPRGPLCLQCPLQPMCLTRGEHATVRRKPLLPRDAFYALIEKEQQVLLEQRPADASLMAGMWQLPELAAPADAKPVCTLKHSITVTNYTVRVYEAGLGSVSRAHAWQGQWFPLSAVNELALTRLARSPAPDTQRRHLEKDRGRRFGALCQVFIALRLGITQASSFPLDALLVLAEASPEHAQLPAWVQDAIALPAVERASRLGVAPAHAVVV